MVASDFCIHFLFISFQSDFCITLNIILYFNFRENVLCFFLIYYNVGYRLLAYKSPPPPSFLYVKQSYYVELT